MADEEIKKTTPKKRTTTSKPKVEEQSKQDPMVEQMQQMMAMMMAQQQQLMELMAKTQQFEQIQVQEVEEEQPKIRKTKRTRQNNKRTKQDLRRDYKGVDIYVTNVSQGIVSYQGKNMRYEWKHNGDIEVMTIEDIVNMPKPFLHTPWLCLDGYENEEQLVDDIVGVLGLDSIYEYIYILQDMDEDINEVELDDIKKAIRLSKANGYDISMDLVILIDRKIRSGELTNYVLIGQLSELLGRKFL